MKKIDRYIEVHGINLTMPTIRLLSLLTGRGYAKSEADVHSTHETMDKKIIIAVPVV